MIALDMVDTLWHYRDLIQQLTAREVQQRYRGLYLGLLWSLATPLLMLAIYTFVFSVVLKARWGGASDGSTSPGEFALTVFAGLIPFTVFSDVVTAAPTLVLRVPNYVKRVVFPLEVLPVVSLGSALVHSLVSVGILLVGVLLLQGRISPALVFLPLAYAPLILLCLGLGWFLASLGVYVRDVGHGIGIITQVLFFMSPVFYPVSAVPAELRFILYVNPLTTILDDFRRTLLWQEAPAWGSWAAWTAVTAGLSLLGYIWFGKTKRGFADVL